MSDRINEEAIAWHDALERDDADWDGFTLWLEADPAHRIAFDEVARVADLVARHRPTLAALTAEAEAPVDIAPGEPRRRWRFAAGGAVAAAILAPMLLLLRPEAAAPPQYFQTAPAGSRQVALADGTRIDLAASTRLGVEAGGQKLVLAGAASFDVPHRPGRMMVVRAGDVSIEDIGTRFEVATAPGMVRVSVADGKVTARIADGQRITVTAGNRLILDTAHGSAELASFAPGDLAAWRRGRLVYDNVPLTLVAADVSRYTGVAIDVDPEVANRRFSGILSTASGSGLVRTLAHVMDLDARPAGKAVRLLPQRAGDRRGPAG